VSKKPIATAKLKLNSVSCACHDCPDKAAFGSEPANCVSHRPIDATAKPLASKKKGRNPNRKRAKYAVSTADRCSGWTEINCAITGSRLRGVRHLAHMRCAEL
jgi:hypothetical protein